MLKKFNYTFVLIILLFLIICAVSASEDNSTDIIQNTESEPISISNAFENDFNNENILENNGDNTTLSSSADESAISIDNNDENLSVSSKSDLKITTYTNFVKNGSTFYIYLTDLNGNILPDKKITASFDGKTYTKTTNSLGRIGVPVNLTKSSTSMEINFKGDDKYNAVTQTVKVYIENSLTMTIGNTKLLTNGYLRIYLSGPAKSISNKTVKIKIGDKYFTKKTSAEGYIVFKPSMSAKTYTVTVTYGNYVVSKVIKCINGNVVNPFKNTIATVNGVPDIDKMPANYVMADTEGSYTLLKSQYREVLKRDSYCIYLNGKLSKYVLFKSKACPDKYHILKREKWNVIERALNTKLVKSNKYNYWPASISASLKGKSYTYSEVRDIQNTGYTCGPTSASVCSQALRNFYSEKFFQIKSGCTHGLNIPVLKKTIEKYNFKSYYFYGSTLTSAVKQLTKGAALIAFLPGHYISIIDVSKDGKKVLVSNSYGSYNVGSGKVPTNWVSLKYFKTKFANIGLVVKLNYKLKSDTKKKINYFYSSMGKNYARQNTNERIPNIGL